MTPISILISLCPLFPTANKSIVPTTVYLDSASLSSRLSIQPLDAKLSMVMPSHIAWLIAVSVSRSTWLTPFYNYYCIICYYFTFYCQQRSSDRCTNLPTNSCSDYTSTYSPRSFLAIQSTCSQTMY